MTWKEQGLEYFWRGDPFPLTSLISQICRKNNPRLLSTHGSGLHWDFVVLCCLQGSIQLGCDNWLRTILRFLIPEIWGKITEDATKVFTFLISFQTIVFPIVALTYAKVFFIAVILFLLHSRTFCYKFFSKLCSLSWASNTLWNRKCWSSARYTTAP